MQVSHTVKSPPHIHMNYCQQTFLVTPILITIATSPHLGAVNYWLDLIPLPDFIYFV